jgi:hypothetical protein
MMFSLALKALNQDSSISFMSSTSTLSFYICFAVSVIFCYWRNGSVMLLQSRNVGGPKLTSYLIHARSWHFMLQIVADSLHVVIWLPSMYQHDIDWEELSSGMWRLVALVRTDVSEECVISIIIAERISELKTVLAITSNWSTLEETALLFLIGVLQLLVTADVPSSLILSTLMMDTIHSYRILVLTGATWCHIPEDSIHSL